MGTIGINAEGSIGLAYNVSSKNVFPSYRFTGRKPTDPLNTMTEAEQVIIAGAANHTNNRWGDYNDMQVDPTNDFTFWTTAMYMPNPAPWSTRVAAFNILYAPLPVSLLSFDGYKVNQTEVNIQWKTTDEKNLDKYVLERASETNGNFEEITTRAAMQNTEATTYQYTDKTINALENYSYRLKMIDKDGKFKYSHVFTIKGKEAAQIELYPNPITQNTLYVRLSEELSDKALQFTFVDYHGKKIKTIRKNKTELERIQSFDISELSTGLYVFICTDNDGNTLLNQVIEKK